SAGARRRGDVRPDGRRAGAQRQGHAAREHDGRARRAASLDRARLQSRGGAAAESREEENGRAHGDRDEEEVEIVTARGGALLVVVAISACSVARAEPRPKLDKPSDVKSLQALRALRRDDIVAQLRLAPGDVENDVAYEK